MSSEKNNSPPELPHHFTGRHPVADDSQWSFPLWIVTGIAAIVMFFILAGVLVSLSVPKIGPRDAALSETGTRGDISGDGNESGEQEKLAASKQEEVQAAVDEPGLPPSSELSGSEGKPEAVPEAVPKPTEDKLSEEPNAEGFHAEKDEEEVFAIPLPKPNVRENSKTSANSVTAKGPMRQRSAAGRLEKLKANGGTAESELAVAAALEWLATHQLPSGAWSFDHRAACDGSCQNSSLVVNAQQDPQMLANAATGLGLLPFLGAGFTHRDGKYQEVVKRAIVYLLKSQKSDSPQNDAGTWMEFTGFMYSHGIASMAICEAYAMTEDPELKPAAQAALNFIARAQDTHGGGWRYQPREPGDMSMLGWQLMALKSGEIGGLEVDKECFQRAEYFIESLRIAGSGAYGYAVPRSDGDDVATTAIGSLGLYYLGRSRASAEQKAAVDFLVQQGPDSEDLYGLYYSTQVMMHLGGDDWPAWNKKVREHLISSQIKDGHATGSWFQAGRGAHRIGFIGGRLYCTAMSAMILEVYYRHLPLYVKKKR